MTTAVFVGAVVDRLRGMDAVAASSIDGGAGNILHELPDVRGESCHRHGSRVRQYVRIYIYSVVYRRRLAVAITRALTSQ